MNVRIGTCGYSYDDWHGPFYPAALPRGKRFGYYAGQFDTVELNFTFYRQPEPEFMAGMAAQAPDGFTFCLKANRLLTHERSDDPAPEAARFLRGIEPLAADGKLGALLIQFPYSFKPSPEAVDYLLRLGDALAGHERVVEFRNAAWLTDETFQLLSDHRLGFCAVDEPRIRGLLPPVCRATARTGYVRLHGRNAARWYDHREAWERYDYLYKIEELNEWVPRIKALADGTDVVYVFANNHPSAQATANARQLRELLGLAPPPGVGGAVFPGGSGELFPPSDQP